jgi:hypothetical protein
MINVCNILAGNLRGENYLGDVSKDGKILQ